MIKVQLYVSFGDKEILFWYVMEESNANGYDLDKEEVSWELDKKLRDRTRLKVTPVYSNARKSSVLNSELPLRENMTNCWPW